MGKERWVSRDGDRVYLETENDGYTFINRGPERQTTEIISADESGIKLASGAGVSSSNGALQKEAMKYFREIAAEANGRRESGQV